MTGMTSPPDSAETSPTVATPAAVAPDSDSDPIAGTSAEGLPGLASAGGAQAGPTQAGEAQAGGPLPAAEAQAVASLTIAAEGLAVLRDATAGAVIAEVAGRIAVAPWVVTCASGSSGFMAAKFAHSLCCIEKPAKFMPPAEAIHGGLGAVTPDSVVVMISRGGKTAELQPIIDVVRRRNATLVALTENSQSVLAEASDLVIPMVITRESDPLNVMATTSNLVAGALLDAVLAAVMAITGFTLEQFGVIHPGGAVGARLAPPPESRADDPAGRP